MNQTLTPLLRKGQNTCWVGLTQLHDFTILQFMFIWPNLFELNIIHTLWFFIWPNKVGEIDYWFKYYPHTGLFPVSNYLKIILLPQIRKYTDNRYSSKLDSG